VIHGFEADNSGKLVKVGFFFKKTNFCGTSSCCCVVDRMLVQFFQLCKLTRGVFACTARFLMVALKTKMKKMLLFL